MCLIFLNKKYLKNNKNEWYKILDELNMLFFIMEMFYV